MGFPLEVVPAGYSTGGRAFGAPRGGGVRHAGCDLIVPLGTPIYAVAPGRVCAGPYAFYHGTFAIEVDHDEYIARYCEIRGVEEGVHVGSLVNTDDLIAYVGRMNVDSMLHFEMYSKEANGPLTDASRPPYRRRSDLMDPTPYLDGWAAEM